MSEQNPESEEREREDRISGTISGISGIYSGIQDSKWLLRSRAGEAPLPDLLREPGLLLRDLISGGISALVTICYSLSFAAMIFAGDLSSHLDDAVRMALMSAGVTIILVSLTSPFYFAVAGPDSRSAAVQRVLAVSLVTGLRAVGITSVSAVMVTLASSTILTGVALYILGRLRMGRWIRYVPYPVIGGFLVSTGWVLALGGINVMTNVQVSLETADQYLKPAVLPHLLVGVAFAVTMNTVLGRAKHYLWTPGLLLGGTLATHILLAAFGVGIDEAQRQGWLLNCAGGGQLIMPLKELFTHPGLLVELFHHGVEIVVLVLITAIALLLSAVAIEVATKRDADLDQELKGHGLANVASGVFGGIVGSNAVARSILNLQAGAATRVSGVFAGLICLILLFINPKLAGYLSRPIMGGTLMYIGMRLLQEWLIKAYRKLSHTDYALVVLMWLLVVYTNKFVVGPVVGALAACLIFAVNYSRVSLVKNTFTCNEYGSKVQRSAQENEVLARRGRQFWVLRLRGYLFFGSIVGLVNDIQSRIKESYAREVQPLRVLVLDCRYVNGMDSSAALSLVKLRQIIEERKMQLVFTGLQPDMEQILRRENCIRDDKVALIFPDLDDALEWCEEAALELEPSLHRIDAPFDQRLGKEFGKVELAQRFKAYVDRIELKQGEYLFKQGDDSGATYVVESGRLSIVFEPPKGEGPPLLLRAVTGNTTIGEMGLYRRSIRSASVVAQADSIIHRLTRAKLDLMEEKDPEVAAAFHTYVIRTLADRLHLMDKTISALER
jgi:SulP family sulfate permease